MRVNLQATNRKKGGEQWLLGLVDNSLTVKRRAEPGVISSIVECYSSVPGGGYTRTPGAAELRQVVYAEVACGIKGVYVRRPQEYPQDYAVPLPEAAQTGFVNRANALVAELETLLPYLSVSEPVNLVARCSSSEAVAKTLLCGDRGVLLVVLRTDMPGRGPAEPIEVVLDVPDWLALTDFIEIGGRHAKGPVTESQEGVRLGIPKLGAVGVYLLPAAKRGDADDERGQPSFGKKSVSPAPPS